jgi:hypothetical protein
MKATERLLLHGLTHPGSVAVFCFARPRQPWGLVYVAGSGGALSCGCNIFQKGGEKMNALKLEDVVKEWETEKLTTEQAIGRLLRLLQALEERLGEVEKRLVELERRARG